MVSCHSKQCRALASEPYSPIKGRSIIKPEILNLGMPASFQSTRPRLFGLFFCIVPSLHCSVFSLTM